MKPFPIPVVPFGPGSQPQDEGYEYLPMPSPEPVPRPRVPQRASPAERIAAAKAIDRIAAGIAGTASGPRIAFENLAPGALAALNDSLGHGEVSAIVATRDPKDSWHVQETAFCGVWRVQRITADALVHADYVEWGDIPEVVREGARRAGPVRLELAALPEGLMNAPSVLHEIREAARHVSPGKPAHVINLSHLPFNEADHATIDSVLGLGYVKVLSRGFGNCHINSTGTTNVWRVQYFNSMNTLLLDTIEVVELPEAAFANAEDLGESAGRLVELAAWLRQGEE